MYNLVEEFVLSRFIFYLVNKTVFTLKPIPMTEKQESGKRSRSGFPARPILASPLVPVWRNHEITKHEWNVQYFSKEKVLLKRKINSPPWAFRVFLFFVFLISWKTEALFSRNWSLAEGEHPVSAKFRGLRNRFVRWWVLGAPHEQPIFTSVFEKNVIFAGANRVSAAFQLRFSCVSGRFQLTWGFFSDFYYFGPKISAFLKVKVLVKPFFCVSAAF